MPCDPKVWRFASSDPVSIRLMLESETLLAESSSIFEELAFGGKTREPLTKYDNLFWELTEAWEAYREDLHAHEWPEYAWVRGHIC